MHQNKICVTTFNANIFYEISSNCASVGHCACIKRHMAILKEDNGTQLCCKYTKNYFSHLSLDIRQTLQIS